MVVYMYIQLYRLWYCALLYNCTDYGSVHLYTILQTIVL
jgi:hypothetical protein